MAIHLRKMFKWWGPERIGASGSFTTAGAGAVSTANLWGIASIARTDVGVFLVTLNESAKEYLPFISCQGAAALAVNRPIISAQSVTAKTVTITVTDGAGAAAETTGLTIHVAVQLRQSN
jgi:hypothetical protein